MRMPGMRIVITRALVEHDLFVAHRPSPSLVKYRLVKPRFTIQPHPERTRSCLVIEILSLALRTILSIQRGPCQRKTVHNTILINQVLGYGEGGLSPLG